MPNSSPPGPSLLDRLLISLLRWRRLARTPGQPAPPLPPVPPVLDGASTLAPHQEQALLEARRQIEEADERLSWMRDRSTVLGRRPPPLTRKAP